MNGYWPAARLIVMLDDDVSSNRLAATTAFCNCATVETEIEIVVATVLSLMSVPRVAVP